MLCGGAGWRAGFQCRLKGCFVRRVICEPNSRKIKLSSMMRAGILQLVCSYSLAIYMPAHTADFTLAVS